MREFEGAIKPLPQKRDFETFGVIEVQQEVRSVHVVVFVEVGSECFYLQFEGAHVDPCRPVQIAVPRDRAAAPGRDARRLHTRRGHDLSRPAPGGPPQSGLASARTAAAPDIRKYNPIQ